jgi:hypothetical protein
VFEMTWAPDGRATFSYRPEQQAGEAAIRIRIVSVNACPRSGELIRVAARNMRAVKAEPAITGAIKE